MVEKKLTELHGILAEKLLERVKDPECKSSGLNVARQFLKDNNIDAIPIDGSPLSKLAESLPFSTEKLKEASEGTEH